MKMQSLATQIKFLGTMEWVVCVNGHDWMHLFPDDDKIKKINDYISEVLSKKKKVPLGDLRTLRGKLVHLASMMTGRLGASITQQLTEQITQHDDCVGKLLTRELSWIQALIDAKLWRRIQLRKRVGSVTVISDASWSQTEDGVISKLCYWVFTAQGPAFGEVCALPDSFVTLLSDRSTQIMPAEMIASILPPLLHPALFRGKAATFFIDNIGALMALVKGGCAKRDLAQLAKFAQTVNAVLDILPWYEYVPSLSNASDGGSRVGVLDSTARHLNVPLSEIAFPSCFYEIFGKGSMDLIYFLKGILKDDNEV